MPKLRIRLALGSLLVLAGSLAGPVPVTSQCMVTNTLVVPGTVGSPYNRVYKDLNGTYVCSLVASNNASLCAPGPALPRNRLTASANTAATNPSCSFNCAGGCGTVIIDGSDGLPVELMDFSESHRASLFFESQLPAGVRRRRTSSS